MLIEYVIAHRIDESPQAFRLMNALFRYQTQDAREGLLPNIFDCGTRPQTLACLQPNQFAEISNEMLLGAEIAGTKPLQIRAVEILKLYWHGVSSRALSELALSSVHRLPMLLET